jgi:hypothetical protein
MLTIDTDYHVAHGKKNFSTASCGYRKQRRNQTRQQQCDTRKHGHGKLFYSDYSRSGIALRGDQQPSFLVSMEKCRFAFGNTIEAKDREKNV